jgi:MinD superfamily P-loop ATPase
MNAGKHDFKTLLVASGKGGTGKTTITAALAVRAEPCAVADCDVDAADLFLLMQPEKTSQGAFKGGRTPSFDAALCTGCGVCVARCRFSALSIEGKTLIHDGFSCEGCGLCSRICPAGAVAMREEVRGDWYLSKTPYGPMAHARLHVAQENSGKLVTVVREHARRLAENNGLPLLIVDGPPGIGCPVMASMTGVDHALLVTEPTLSGLHDLKRIIALATRFKVPAKVCINKFDLNETMTLKIEEFCASRGLELIGKIPYDRAVLASCVAGTPLGEEERSAASQAIKTMWHALSRSLYT